MADTKIVVNKHYRNPGDINVNSFTTLKLVNKYGLGKDEVLREGEIILCNDSETPGIFMITESASTLNPGKVINITSGENIKLSSAYTESQEEGSGLTLTTADTVADAFGKVEKHLSDIEIEIENIPIGSVIKSITIEKHAEAFIGLDGELHPAGSYLIIEYDSPSGSKYSYNDVTAFFVEDWYGTEAEYEAMVEEGTIDPNRTYYTYEE